MPGAELRNWLAASSRSVAAHALPCGATPPLGQAARMLSLVEPAAHLAS
jgi:hypothetical protein